MSVRDLEHALESLENDERFFVARVYSCCARHGIERLVAENHLRPDDPFVITTAQDEELWRATGELWLTWGGGPDAGALLRDALQSWQLDFTWEGGVQDRFLVRLEPPVDTLSYVMGPEHEGDDSE